MKLTAHFIVSITLALSLYPFFGLDALWVFVTGFLIDIDYYFYYVIKYRKFNVFEGNRFFKEVKLYNVLCVFHTIEVFLLVVVLSFLSLVGKILLIGLVVHYIMDIYNEIKLGRMDSKSKSLVKYLVDLRK